MNERDMERDSEERRLLREDRMIEQAIRCDSDSYDQGSDDQTNE